MNADERLSMPLREAIFSMHAIRRLRPDPIPAADPREILTAAEVRARGFGTAADLALNPSAGKTRSTATRRAGGDSVKWLPGQDSNLRPSG